MRITDVRTHVLLDPGYDVGATSSAQDTIVVEIETDEGLTGIGETDLNAWIARACIEAPGTHTMDRGLRRCCSAATRSTRGDLAGPVRGHRDDRPPRRADQRDRRDRHRALGHRGQGRRRAELAAARRAGARPPDAVRVAAARGRLVRRLRDLDDRLGDARARPRLHRRQARGDVRRALRAQGAARPRRVDRRGRACRARGRRARDDADGRRAVRVRRGRARAAHRRGDRGVRHLLPRDAALGRRPRRLRRAHAALAGADRPGRVADHALRVRGADRRRLRAASRSPTSVASAG